MAFSAVEGAIRLAVAILSVLIFVVGTVAYARRPTGRMLLVLALFTAFLVQGLILLVEIFVRTTSLTESTYFAFQFVEILLIAAILLKR